MTPVVQRQEMQTSEKFCLRWNDFQENVNSSFRDLRKDNEFTDVTLACEDGYQMEAHKVILASSSPFFQNMLKRNKHANPLIYMRGMKSDDLVAIIDFFYYGEANIYQENLDTFLNIAEELQLKGLSGEQEGGYAEGKEFKNSMKTCYKPKIPSFDPQSKKESNQTSITKRNEIYSEGLITPSMAVALPKQQVSGDMKELDEKIETMMVRGENMISGNGKGSLVRAYICTVCGKEAKKTNMKNHIEANHMDGIAVPCNICEKNFRSTRSLRQHMNTANSCHTQTHSF